MRFNRDGLLRPWTDPANALPLSSIILVTYNKVELTRQCIDSIYEQTRAPFEIVVVDNASSDDTVAYLRSLDKPNLKVVAKDENLGFGRGCNVGAEHSDGEVLVFLNNDTLLSPGWLTGLLRKLQAHPQIGMVGPVTNVASNAQLLDPERPAGSASFYDVAAELSSCNRDTIAFVRRMIGFCMAIPKPVWQACGPFDESYGIGHYEDDDLSLSLERGGYKAAVARDVYVYHFAGQSFDAAGVAQLANIRKKAFLFYQKWGNAFLDWPDLLLNLQDTVHVVLPATGADMAIPEWRSGDVPFLLTVVDPDGDPTVATALAEHHQQRRIFGVRLARSHRPLGEAMNVGMASHDSIGQLLLASGNGPWTISEMLEQVKATDGEPRALTFDGPKGEGPLAYYLPREILRQVGAAPPHAKSFAELVSAHARRVRAAGLRCEAITSGESAPSMRTAGTLGRMAAAGEKAACASWMAQAKRFRWQPLPQVRPPAGEDKTVNITMLSYDRLDFTQQAVEAVRRRTSHPFRLVVVDNGSSAETVAWLKEAKRKGWIDVLVLNDENLGVAVAANQGWRICETDYYLKLDNDIVIEKDGWLGELVRVADGLPDAGMVGYNFEPTSYELRRVGGLSVRPKDSHLGGACTLITKRAHEVAGFWCEDYFPYSEEDLDMGLRLGLAGLRHYYLEDEQIGAHLPRGRATELADWRSRDDEDNLRYRSFKDEARREHIGKYSTLWVNQRLYRRRIKSLYCDAFQQTETLPVKLSRSLFRSLKRLTTR